MAQKIRYYVIKQVIRYYSTNKQATLEELLETMFSVSDRVT
jgi:hypothetical protein